MIKTNGYQKMCDTNKNGTKMGVIIKGVYCTCNMHALTIFYSEIFYSILTLGYMQDIFVPRKGICQKSRIKVGRLQNLYIYIYIYISKIFLWVFSILTSCWDLLVSILSICWCFEICQLIEG